MNKRLLTFDDLINFYSKYKKTIHFDAKKNGEPIVVQTKGEIIFEENKNYADGLTPVRLQACHTDKNLNKSSISYEIMRDKFLPTFVNRPILGFIHEVDGQPCFYGHNAHIEENSDGEEEIVYDEIPVGIIPETNNASLEYDEEQEHYNVMVDGYLFDEYSKASEILAKKKKLSVSVEISIYSMSFSPKTGILNIEDGYFSGVTILQCDEDGNEVKPGMAGSNITLKDFSETNNSFFSLNEEDEKKLIEMQKTINEMVDRFNINQANAEDDNIGKEEDLIVEEEIKDVEVTENNEVEEIQTETEEVTEESTEEVTETSENESEEEVETPEVVDTVENTEEVQAEEVSEETEIETEETDEVTDEVQTVETEMIEKHFERDGKKFSISFELSHEDVKYGLYNLIEQFDELDNEWYNIRAVYDDYFVMQGWCTGVIYGCKYKTEDDNVALDGERFRLYEELLTESEKAELDNMRANYSLISDKLSKYELEELNAQRTEVFNDKAYADFIETDSFKEIKSKIDTYSVEDLRTACDLAFAQEIKKKGTFSLCQEDEIEKKPTMFAFGHKDEKCSFLDGLLKK